MSNPLRCERCGRPLESDDAISIIEGVCGPCRGQPSPAGFASQRPPASATRPRYAPPPIAPRRELRAMPTFEIPQPPPLQAGGPVRPAWRPSPASASRPRPLTPIDQSFAPGQEIHVAHRLRRRRRDLIIGVSLGLVITVAFTSYLISSRSEAPPFSVAHNSPTIPLRLAVRPSFAKVTLDGEEVGAPDEQGALTLNLPADGTVMKWLEVSAKGYHTSRRPVSAYGGTTNINVELIQKPYDVAIRTQPPGAEVWINEEFKGNSPLSVTLVPGEKAQLAVKRAGYETLTQLVSPPTDSERLDLNLTLKAQMGLVRVETSPPGAQISADGKVCGISPCDIPVDSKRLGKALTISAALPGHATGETKIDLPADRGARIAPVYLSLVAIGPELQIGTDPPGGRIVIDGVDQGLAPLKLRLPPSKVGSSLVVEAHGSDSRYGRQEVIAPAAGVTQRLTIALNPAQSVVFLLWPAARNSADHYALLAQIKERIHRLSPEQRFAVLISRPGGVQAWPESGGLLPAGSDQKIRAYDSIRAVRADEPGELVEALDTALALKPTSVWIHCGNEISSDQLERMSVIANNRRTAIHVVTTVGGADEAAIKDWALAHQGSYSVLGRARTSSLAASGVQQ